MILCSKLIEDVYQRNARVDDMDLNYFTLLLHCILFPPQFLMVLHNFQRNFMDTDLKKRLLSKNAFG